MWAPRGRKKQLPGLSSWKKKSSCSCRREEERRKGEGGRGGEGGGIGEGGEGKEGRNEPGRGREEGKGKERNWVTTINESKPRQREAYHSYLPMISLCSLFLKMLPLFQLQRKHTTW